MCPNKSRIAILQLFLTQVFDTVNSQGLSFLPHVTGWAGFVASAVDSVEPSVIQKSDVTKAIKIHWTN